VFPVYIKMRRVDDQVAFYWTQDPVNGPLHPSFVLQVPAFKGAKQLVVGPLGCAHQSVTDPGFQFDNFKVFPISSAPSVTLGDLNADGKVNVQDATTSLRIAVGSITPTDAQKAAGDVNKDGKWNVQDTTLILRFAVGAITAFP
jgi:hypothetical protein